MKRLLAAAALALLSAAAFAQAPATQWEAGKHYFVIDPPLPTQTPGKVEVTEVFSYGCPACNFAHTYVDALRKHLPPTAQMDFVPASFNPSEDWVVFQRAYLTAKALGIAEKSHDAMFDAVWKTKELGIYDNNNRIKSPLPTIEDVAKFYVQYGVKADQFVATANSFTINTRMKQADAYIKSAGVDQTPTIIVNGKYRLTTVSAGGNWDKAEQLVLFLVDKEAGAAK
ncbi:MAG: thiol:disulfide interchange protein DsbA/DsbL [Proteobacteria bacterium]|nr:thiol:disulfide interchange protein DsbA/DsbL [Pseudomonadota bacterium]